MNTNKYTLLLGGIAFALFVVNTTPLASMQNGSNVTKVDPTTQLRRQLCQLPQIVDALAEQVAQANPEQFIALQTQLIELHQVVTALATRVNSLPQERPIVPRRPNGPQDRRLSSQIEAHELQHSEADSGNNEITNALIERLAQLEQRQARSGRVCKRTMQLVFCCVTLMAITALILYHYFPEHWNRIIYQVNYQMNQWNIFEQHRIVENLADQVASLTRQLAELNKKIQHPEDWLRFSSGNTREVQNLEPPATLNLGCWTTSENIRVYLECLKKYWSPNTQE